MLKYWRSVVNVIDGLSNAIFYFFAFLMLVFPLFVWVYRTLAGRSGLLWVGAAVLFAVVVPAMMELLAVSVMELMEKIKDGKLLWWFFEPLRSLSAILGIVGVFKLEYALVHGMPGASGSSWLGLIWEFITSF